MYWMAREACCWLARRAAPQGCAAGCSKTQGRPVLPQEGSGHFAEFTAGCARGVLIKQGVVRDVGFRFPSLEQIEEDDTEPGVCGQRRILEGVSWRKGGGRLSVQCPPEFQRPSFRLEPLGGPPLKVLIEDRSLVLSIVARYWSIDDRPNWSTRSRWRREGLLLMGWSLKDWDQASSISSMGSSSSLGLPRRAR